MRLIIILVIVALTGCGYTPRQHAAIWMGAIAEGAKHHQQVSTPPPRPTVRCVTYPQTGITECR